MRIASLVALATAALPASAQGSAKVVLTETNEVDDQAGTGNLGWGATGLPFGYEAGAGLNYNAEEGNSSIGGGFNGAVPGQADGAFGGGWTVNGSAITLGLGGALGGLTFDVAIVQDRATGEVTFTVNGKDVKKEISGTV